MRGCTAPAASTRATCVARGEAPDGQVLLLRRDPLGQVELGEGLTGTHAVERRAHVQLLDVAHRPGLHHRLVALVPGNAADRADHGPQRTLNDLGRAHAEVLLDARAHRDRALIVAAGAAIDRHQHHVHEGRLRRRVEAFAGHHGVVVVEDGLAGGRIDIAGLDTLLDVASRRGLAGGDAAGRVLGPRRVGRGSCHAARLPHAAVLAGLVSGIAARRQRGSGANGDQRESSVHRVPSFVP
jgi:hypothetical protein